MKCSYCHHPIHKEDKYCVYCGKSVEHKNFITFKSVIIIIMVLICLSILCVWNTYQGGYPKGIYAMYDETGKTIFTLSLKSNGSYTIEDKQDYSQYDESKPLIVLHHDFTISDNGIEWKEIINGKCTKTSTENTYLLSNVLGGLFTSSEDAYLVYGADIVYLYSTNEELGYSYRLVRIS